MDAARAKATHERILANARRPPRGRGDPREPAPHPQLPPAPARGDAYESRSSFELCVAVDHAGRSCHMLVVDHMDPEIAGLLYTVSWRALASEAYARVWRL